MRDRLDQHGPGPAKRRGSGISARARLGLAVGILVAGSVLVLLGGGFPPLPWKVLFFALTGQSHAPIHFSQVFIQSVVLVVAWLLLVLVAIQVVRLGHDRIEELDDEQEARSASETPTTRTGKEAKAPSYATQAQAWRLPEQEVVEGHFPESARGNQAQLASVAGTSTFGSMLLPPFPGGEAELPPATASRRTQVHAQGSDTSLHPVPPQAREDTREEGSRGENGGKPRAAMGLTTHIDSALVEAAIEDTSRKNGVRLSHTEEGKTLPALFTIFNDSSRRDAPQSAFRIAPDDVLPRDGQTGMALTGWSLCHMGTAVEKETLEDTVLVATGVRTKRRPPVPFAFFILADGIAVSSEHTSGRLVSCALSEALLSVLWGTDALDQEGVKDLLTNGVQYANNILFQQNQKQHTSKIATMSVVLVLGGVAYIANVGDNRVYFYRAEEGLVQVTFDHSSIEQQLEQGKITPEQVFHLPKERQVYRTLGHQATVNVDVFALPLKTEDLLLMCSDGVWKVIRKTTLQQLVEQLVGPPIADPSLLCPQIVRHALVGGGYDRVSALAVQARSHSVPSQ